MFAVRSQEMNKMITMGGQYIYELWSANRKHDTRGMTLYKRPSPPLAVYSRSPMTALEKQTMQLGNRQDLARHGEFGEFSRHLAWMNGYRLQYRGKGYDPNGLLAV
jgi:hypothetical protein